MRLGNCHYMILVCIQLLWAQLLFGEFQTFENSDGVSIEAELVELSADGQTVTIKLRNGRSIDALLTAFSQKDQAKIKKWWSEVQAEKELLSELVRLDINVKMSQKSSSDRYNNWISNLSDKVEAFFPEITINNNDVQSYKGNKVRVVIIATDESDPSQRLIVSASTLKTDLPYRAKTVLESDPFRLRLYDYKSNYSGYRYAHGYTYEGYVVVIQNARGDTTHTKASKSKYLNNMEIIWKCKSGEMYNKNLSRKLKAEPNSYFIQ